MSLSEEQTSKTLAQTYLFVGDKAYFVSTINRRSSAIEAAGSVYAETMVWEVTPKTLGRLGIVYQTSGSEDSIHKHIKVCGRIFNGELKEMQDE